MNDRDCENCVHKVNGACNVWECKFEPKSEIYRPCSKCHNEECVFMGSSDTHSLCEDFEPKFGTWIPVSEDSPKDAYGCIVTVMDVDLKTQNEFENILPYFVGYDGETWNNAGGEPIPYEVIAWMKAPEPYKAEGNEE